MFEKKSFFVFCVCNVCVCVCLRGERLRFAQWQNPPNKNWDNVITNFI